MLCFRHFIRKVIILNRDPRRIPIGNARVVLRRKRKIVLSMTRDAVNINRGDRLVILTPTVVTNSTRVRRACDSDQTHVMISYLPLKDTRTPGPLDRRSDRIYVYLWEMIVNPT